MFKVLLLVVIGAEIILQVLINYPPTLEQLNLNIASPAALWASRLLAFILLIYTVIKFSKTLDKKLSGIFSLLIISSPTLSFLWTTSPSDAIKMFLTLIIFLWAEKKYIQKFPVILITTLVILISVFGIFKQKPDVMEHINLKRAAEDVTFRFTREDSLTPNIKIPLFIRRVGYNKYYIAFKKTLDNSMKFFNPETLFFQEVHPMHQKATVMFLWPGIIFFAFGVWELGKDKNKQRGRILLLSSIAFIYFLFSGGSIEKRLAFLMIPVAIVMTTGIVLLTASKKRLIRIIGMATIILYTYGWIGNIYDRYTRPQYWYDNRPLAYEFAFENIKKNGFANNPIVFSDTMYAAQSYCKYYLNNCDSVKIAEKMETLDKDTIYIGFIGNILGAKTEGGFSEDIKYDLSTLGYELVAQTRLHDNIANSLGQDLVIVQIK